MNPPNRNLRDISRSNRRRTLPSTNTNANPGHPNERCNSLPTTNTDPADPASTDALQIPLHIPEEAARLTRLYNEQVQICLQLRLDYNDILADKELAEQNQVDAEEKVEQVKEDMRKMKEEHEDEVQKLRDQIKALEAKQVSNSTRPAPYAQKDELYINGV
jgi:hypothetical protein